MLYMMIVGWVFDIGFSRCCMMRGCGENDPFDITRPSEILRCYVPQSLFWWEGNWYCCGICCGVARTRQPRTRRGHYPIRSPSHSASKKDWTKETCWVNFFQQCALLPPCTPNATKSAIQRNRKPQHQKNINRTYKQPKNRKHKTKPQKQAPKKQKCTQSHSQ